MCSSQPQGEQTQLSRLSIFLRADNRCNLQTTSFVPKRRRAGQDVANLFQPIVPFVVQSAVSMGAYTAGLAAAQGLGSLLRTSCATPVAGPLGGVIGVGFASALAGQASIKLHRIRRDGYDKTLSLTPDALLREAMRDTRYQDLAIDAVLGILAFRVMGGRFSSVMPSDLTQVGAIARESLPAAGMQYAREEKRSELSRFFRRDGCHHCGTRRGPVVGDHMPPNKRVQDTIHAMHNSLMGQMMRMPYVAHVVDALGMTPKFPLQRYYPQCRRCSLKQAAAVRHSRSHLVFHQILHRGGTSSAWHYAGVIVGLRHTEHSATPNGKPKRIPYIQF